jgi:hypothetical protein
MRVPFTLDDLFSDKRFKDIVKAPIEKQAEYADAVCVANAKDINFCRNQVKGKEDRQYETPLAIALTWHCMDARKREMLTKTF